MVKKQDFCLFETYICCFFVNIEPNWTKPDVKYMKYFLNSINYILLQTKGHMEQQGGTIQAKHEQFLNIIATDVEVDVGLMQSFGPKCKTLCFLVVEYICIDLETHQTEAN